MSRKAGTDRRPYRVAERGVEARSSEAGDRAISKEVSLSVAVDGDNLQSAVRDALMTRSQIFDLPATRH
jgi:hypothetical protein